MAREVNAGAVPPHHQINAATTTSNRFLVSLWGFDNPMA
jgi:hypothetical protein